MSRKQLVTVAVLFTIAVAFLPDIALARAGGGGGGGGGGFGLAALVLWPFVLLYSGVMTFLVAYKRRESKELLERLEQFDPLWSEKHIRRRVEATYFSVQQAWTQRDQELAREFMSDRLYEKHKRQTDAMIANHRRNVLENVNLVHADIIGVRDFNVDAKDRFEVHIKGSMVDYHVNDVTGAVVSGNAHSSESFTEIWRFVRGSTDWVLDEIQQEAGLNALMSTDCGSESVSASA